MSDIGPATRSALLADGTVAGFLSTRVYPDRLPQGPTLPAAVYHVISGDEEGSLTGRAGLTHARIQVDAYASTRLAANALAAAIRNALTDQTGSRGTWGTVSVTGCSCAAGERYGTQQLDDGSDDPQWITSRDFLVSFIDT